MPQYLAEVITPSWLATYFAVSVGESGSISYAWPSPNHMWLETLSPNPPCSPSMATRLPGGAGVAGDRCAGRGGGAGPGVVGEAVLAAGAGVAVGVAAVAAVVRVGEP